jgi:hypothetical protein
MQTFIYHLNTIPLKYLQLINFKQLRYPWQTAKKMKILPILSCNLSNIIRHVNTMSYPIGSIVKLKFWAISELCRRHAKSQAMVPLPRVPGFNEVWRAYFEQFKLVALHDLTKLPARYKLYEIPCLKQKTKCCWMLLIVFFQSSSSKLIKLLFMAETCISIARSKYVILHWIPRKRDI